MIGFLLVVTGFVCAAAGALLARRQMALASRAFDRITTRAGRTSEGWSAWYAAGFSRLALAEWWLMAWTVGAATVGFGMVLIWVGGRIVAG
ncbi:MAG TPA: hypothetical protein VGB20_01985 [bacterium]